MADAHNPDPARPYELTAEILRGLLAYTRAGLLTWSGMQSKPECCHGRLRYVLHATAAPPKLTIWFNDTSVGGLTCCLPPGAGGLRDLAELVGEFMRADDSARKLQMLQEAADSFHDPSGASQ